MHEEIISIILFSTAFLLFTAGIERLTKKISSIPYTVALLVSGALSQSIVRIFGLHFSLDLGPEIIYYILLPLLLFESAFHINFHQFQLQFKTITFIATAGLLSSIMTVGLLISFALGLPLEVGLLFGALISATDPIAVISLFKTLGAPKRLGLIADGESMFNDATAVIIFRVIAGIVIAESPFQSHILLGSFSNFIYVFIGSIVFGFGFGYLLSRIIEKISNDRVLETTITVAAALGSFVIAEHYFGLSGVIATVITGITVGNLGKTKFSPGVHSFVEEFWAYFAFLSVSLVFFFATFNLDFTIFVKHPHFIAIAVFIVLIARAVSVYGSIFFTNRLSFFKNEPNIPLRWQHILNWGGLRGVIPLVLVYSLPESFVYRDEIVSFTFGTLLFTLLVNGLTIRLLLLKLGLHLPRQEEEMITEEMTILELEEAKHALSGLQDQEFDPELLHAVRHELNREENRHKTYLNSILTPEAFELSLRLQNLRIERDALHDLFHMGVITENAYFDFETQLDLQQDALEYPEVYRGRGYEPGGKLSVTRVYRLQVARLKKISKQFPFLRYLMRSSSEQIVRDRLSVLKARIITSEMVIEYLVRLRALLRDSDNAFFVIESLITEHAKLIELNKSYIAKLSQEFPRVLQQYQKNMALAYIRANRFDTSSQMRDTLHI